LPATAQSPLVPVFQVIVAKVSLPAEPPVPWRLAYYLLIRI
jgi:hypothetical protein